MKRLVLIIALLFFPIKGLCACEYSLINEYMRLGSNVSYTFDYVYEDNSVYFDVYILNMTEGMNAYLYGNTIPYKSNKTYLGRYNNGMILTIGVYGCDRLIKTLNISLPYYNEYYNDPLCEGLEKYTICQKWAYQGLSYNEFKKNVIRYKNKIEGEKVEDKIDNKINILKIIGEFFIKYYIYLLILIIIGGITGIIFIKQKEKRFFKYKI